MNDRKDIYGNVLHADEHLDEDGIRCPCGDGNHGKYDYEKEKDVFEELTGYRPDHIASGAQFDPWAWREGVPKPPVTCSRKNPDRGCYCWFNDPLYTPLYMQPLLILYIGRAKVLRGRLGTHWREPMKWKRDLHSMVDADESIEYQFPDDNLGCMPHVAIWLIPDERERAVFEQHLISTLHPKSNLITNTKAQLVIIPKEAK